MARLGEVEDAGGSRKGGSAPEAAMTAAKEDLVMATGDLSTWRPFVLISCVHCTLDMTWALLLGLGIQTGIRAPQVLPEQCHPVSYANCGETHMC